MRVLSQITGFGDRYRQPHCGDAARWAAADVDRLRNGRFVLGLAIGDRDDEFAKMGCCTLPCGNRLFFVMGEHNR